MAQKTDAELQIYADANINTNGTNAITGGLHNTMLTHMIDSKANNNDIGNRTYTEENYVTDSESITASIDALDQAIGQAGSIMTLSQTFSSAQVKALTGGGHQLGISVGGGELLEVLSAVIYLNYNSAAYVASDELYLAYGNYPVGNKKIVTWSPNILTYTSDMCFRGSFTSNIFMPPENSMYLESDSNPTTGDSPIKLLLTYRVITL